MVTHQPPSGREAPVRLTREGPIVIHAGALLPEEGWEELTS
jgi:hypothetical protein